MSVELLYTSAAQGLKQGSRGFCTVLSTIGMPVNLANRLESLSAYRHVFPPNSPDAAQNPVSYSHLRITVGGRPLSILSRISDYGVDYSQRTNKLAHHVVVEGPDLVPAGPAWVMSQPAIMRSQWDGQCATPATGPTVPPSNQSARVCLRWSGLCNDAGWGGVVAEAFAQPPGKPLWIIFTLAQSAELLGMINESIALLPAEQRWQATFSTYATNLPPDADCKVRCVLAGTDDARLAPARGRVIDLSKQLPPIATSAETTHVLAARNGTSISAVDSPTRPAPHAKARPSVPQNEFTEEIYTANESNLAAATQQPLKSHPVSEIKLARVQSSPPTVKNKPYVPENTQANPGATNGKKLKLAIIGLTAIAALLFVSTLVLFVQRKPVEVAKNDTPEVNKVLPPKLETEAQKAKQQDGDSVPEGHPHPINSAEENNLSLEKPPKPSSTQKSEPKDSRPSEEVNSTADQVHQNEDDDERKSKKPTAEAIANPDSSTDSQHKDDTSPPSSTKVAETKPAVLIGKIQAAKLLKGEVAVKIEIEDFTDLPPKDARYSYEKEGRARSFEGSFPTDGRPSHVKELACTTVPLKLLVEVDPKDKELKERAKKIKEAWEKVTKSDAAWQEVLRKSKFPNQKMLELQIEKPAELVSEFQQQLAELEKRTSEVVENLAKREAALEQEYAASLQATKEANVLFQQQRQVGRYKNGLIEFQKLLVSLQSEIGAIENDDRELYTGIILYVGRAGQKLDGGTEISRKFRLNANSTPKDKDKKHPASADEKDGKQVSEQTGIVNE